MKQHKILEDFGIARKTIPENLCEENGSENRSHNWRMERKIYGFDNRETWNMDYNFVLWLLERLVMYKEVSIVDLTYHKGNFKGKKITQEEAIDLMIEKAKACALIDSHESEWSENWDDLMDLWKEWGPAMWW